MKDDERIQTPHFYHSSSDYLIESPTFDRFEHWTDNNENVGAVTYLCISFHKYAIKSIYGLAEAFWSISEDLAVEPRL